MICKYSSTTMEDRSCIVGKRLDGEASIRTNARKDTRSTLQIQLQYRRFGLPPFQTKGRRIPHTGGRALVAEKLLVRFLSVAKMQKTLYKIEDCPFQFPANFRPDMCEETVFPLYCPICRRLAFVVRSESCRFVLADIAIGSWSIHPCFLSKPDIVKNDSAVEEILQTAAVSDRLPFVWYKNPPNYKNREGALGVVTKTAVSVRNAVQLEVVTTNNELLALKPLFAADGIRAGTVLDVRERVRIGKGRYRLEHCKRVPPPENFSDRLSVPKEYYKLVLSSIDQEKLESFVDRLLIFLDGECAVTLSVIPLAIAKKKECLYHRRQIILIPVEKLIKGIFQLPIPDHISLSVHQIKGD